MKSLARRLSEGHAISLLLKWGPLPQITSVGSHRTTGRKRRNVEGKAGVRFQLDRFPGGTFLMEVSLNYKIRDNLGQYFGFDADKYFIYSIYLL